MSGKLFLDVFPGLQLEGKLKEFVDLITVKKVAVSHEKTHLRVYISSTQWIHKKYIYQLEEAIATQLFSKSSMNVKIIEHFVLSSQYKNFEKAILECDYNRYRLLCKFFY